MRPEDLGIGKLFERIRDAVIVAEAKTRRIVLCNPAATSILGYSSSEALELRLEALIPELLEGPGYAGIARCSEIDHGPYVQSHGLLELPTHERALEKEKRRSV